jgi:hypothetical protein
MCSNATAIIGFTKRKWVLLASSMMYAVLDHIRLSIDAPSAGSKPVFFYACKCSYTTFKNENEANSTGSYRAIVKKQVLKISSTTLIASGGLRS